jgi:hypothetical protein
VTTITGGLRTRFIHDSLTAVLKNGLAAQGWLDADRRHQPLQFLHGPHHWDVPVAYNAIVITNQSIDNDDDIELGSTLSTDRHAVSVDLYAESESLGLEVGNDMRDLLRGRLPGGADFGVFPILDFRLPTPAAIGYATVIDVRIQRSIVQVPEEWVRHVYTVATTIGDTYY